MRMIKELVESVLLQEIFSGSNVEFGTDENRKNRGWLSKGTSMYTFFRIDGTDFSFSFDRSGGMIGFGVRHSGEIGSNDPEDYHSKKGDVGNKSPARVFNTAFGIAIEVMKTLKPKEIWFTGATTKLSSLYSRVIKNPKIEQIVSDLGYTRHTGSELVIQYHRMI